MIIRYKEREYTFPDTLADITIGQRIEFYDLYGKALDDKAIKIGKIQYQFQKDSELSSWHLENAVCQFAFYTGLPLAELQRSADAISILKIYQEVIYPLLVQEREIEIRTEYEFAGEKWIIAPPELLPTSTMTFNEFLHGKEVVRQMNQVGNGKWHSLPYLCAIYLRKEGEPFQESLVADGSERMQLMYSLPLDIAIGVGFFLTGTLNICLSTSLFFSPLSQRESTQLSTLSAGDG